MAAECAPRHDSLAQDIVAALGERARRNSKLLGKTVIATGTATPFVDET